MQLDRTLRGLLACVALAFQCGIAHADLVPLVAKPDPTEFTEVCNNGTDLSETISVFGPSTLQPGKPERVQVTIKNTSPSTLWFGEQVVKDNSGIPTRLAAWNLSTQGHNNQVVWDGWQCGGYRKNGIGDQRTFLNDPASPATACTAPIVVRPTEQRTFDFNITAPVGSTSPVTFSWAMVVDYGTQCQGFFKQAMYAEIPVSGPAVTCPKNPPASSDPTQWLLEVWNNETLDAITGTDGLQTDDAKPVEQRWINSDFANNTTGSVTLDLDRLNGAKRLSECSGLEHYSARLTRNRTLFQQGSYTFRADADDGVRLSVQGKRFIDSWAVQGAHLEGHGTASQDAEFPVVIEYFQHEGGSQLHVDWSKDSGPTPIGAPALRLDGVSGNVVALSWGPVAGAASYSLKRGTTQNGPYSVLQSGLSGSSTTDTVAADGTYYYVLTAVAAGVESNNSNEVRAVVNTAPPTVPAPVLNDTTVSGNTVSLSWSSVSGATYNLLRGTSNGGPYTPLQNNLPGTSTTDVVSADGIYFYVVRAVVGGNQSGNSNQASATIGTAPPPVPKPQLSLDGVFGNSVVLSWLPVNNAIYNLKRSTTPGGPYSPLQFGLATTRTTDVTSDGTYYYVLSALVGGRESENSNEVQAKVGGTPPPGEATISLSLVGPDGRSVGAALSVNAEGWPAPNPLELRVTLSCPAGANDCFGQLRTSIDGSNGALRVYGLPSLQVCTIDGLLKLSQHFIHWSCPQSVLGGVTVRRGESLTVAFKVMVQPSNADTMNIRATWFTAQATPLQVVVPPASIHPLIVVPGILGTMPPSYSTGQLDPMLGLYDPLMEQLQAMGYEENISLFRFPYDWRNSNRVTARFLRDRIRQALAVRQASYRSNDQVDLLVHSMGGIITRTLVEDEGREANNTQLFYNAATEGIRKVIFAATPHLGFPEDYKVFESHIWSDFLSETGALNIAMNSILYPALVKKHWEAAHPGASPPVVCGEPDPLGGPVCISDEYGMSHDQQGGGIDSLREMLPTTQADTYFGAYLCATGQPCQAAFAYPFGRQLSPLLPGLNAKVGLFEQRIRSENIYVIYGTDPSPPSSTANDTDVVYDVKVPVPLIGTAGWLNGEPYQTFKTAAGDDLIPEYSSNLRLLLNTIPADHVAGARTDVNGQVRFGLAGPQFRHKEIVRSHELQTVYLAKWLAGLAPLTFEQPYVPPDILSDLATGVGWLLVGECPVNLLLTDMQTGKRLGHDPVSGITYNEIERSLYAAPNSESQFMMFGQLPPGTYNLRLNAFGDGQYRLGLHRFSSTGSPRLWLGEGNVRTGDVIDHTIVIGPTVPATNQPPIADAGPDQTVPAGPSCTADVRLDGSRSSDPDGEALSFDWSGSFGHAVGVEPLVTLRPGVHDITLHVQDGQRKGRNARTRVTVTALPPEITSVTATPSVLEPADGTMRDVQVAVDLTASCASVTCKIVDVDITEGERRDWSIVAPLRVKLRAARSGDDEGRLYKLRIECQTPGTSPVRKSVTVKVPPPGRMKGDASIRHRERLYKYKFDLSESRGGKDAGSVSLEVKDDDDDHDAHERKPTEKFRATRVDAVRFSNDDDFNPGSGLKVDTVTATGVGTWNGKAGYSFELKATDQGEPGADRDRFKIVVRDAQGNRVAGVSEKIDSGNNQSEKAPK